MFNVVVLKLSQLPMIIKVLGGNGEKEFYEIRPAGRKFGAYLCKVQSPVRQLFLQEER